MDGYLFPSDKWIFGWDAKTSNKCLKSKTHASSFADWNYKFESANSQE